MSHQQQKYEVTPGLYFILIFAFLLCMPGLYFGITHTHIAHVWGVICFGGAIFAAAFILSWAAEVVQIDISESLAVAILALLAVLPEYAVDFVFTWNSVHDPEQLHYAVANMTGANRLLVGLGWPFILFLYVVFKKKKEIRLEDNQKVEVFYLAMASLYSLTIILRHMANLTPNDSLTLYDTLILVLLFFMYTRRAAQMETEEPEMVGPVKIIANMKTAPRRFWTIILFLFSGAVIFFVAEPFTESLVGMGEQFGLNKFLLVQWLAPIASEAPEFIIAATWTLRGAATSSMKALISSKVNQWTLLIGTIPLVYAISSWVSNKPIRPFPIDTLQHQEIFLTAAQSVFAVALLVNLRMSKADGILLFVLFLAQLIVEKIRLEMVVVYLVLAVIYNILHRKHLIPAMKLGLNFRKK